MRIATGLRKPKNRVPGTDVAGTVEAVGKDVQSLRPGDKVFGWCTGAFAEYARATEDHFVTKPANLTFEQAAAVGVSATHGAPAPSRRGAGPARPEGPHQRGVGRGGHVRRADRQGVRSRGDRRDAARGTWTWSAPSAPTTSSTTRRRTSQPAGHATTSSSTTSATTRCRTRGGPSRPTGRCSPTAEDIRAASSAG